VPDAAAEDAPSRTKAPARLPAKPPANPPQNSYAERKVLKPFNPRVADTSRDRVAPLPGPPALASIPPKPIPGLTVGHKTCCVGTATFEPAKPARVQRVLGKIPGLRRIHQNPDGVEGYVAPHPAREISMVLTPESRAILPRGTMDLKATVDESGHVTRVQLLSPKDEELVRLAAYAANAWPFVPAKVNDKPVPGDVILHFTFAGN
jgi:TonB family protein